MDAPAVLVSADASTLAACADGVILVVESGKEEPKTVQLAKKRLEQAKAKILGCVLNNMKVDRRYDEFCRMNWRDDRCNRLNKNSGSRRQQCTATN